jgi:hypothetical protein
MGIVHNAWPIVHEKSMSSHIWNGTLGVDNYSVRHSKKNTFLILRGSEIDMIEIFCHS